MYKYRCLYTCLETENGKMTILPFSVSTFKDITCVKFISLLHRRTHTMLVVAKPVTWRLDTNGHVKPEVI